MSIVPILACFFLLAYGKSVPPQVCFEPFNWQDCGRPPVHVLYYYKSGSRCEVGIWRGCLPNLNMFKDEYECVNTCVYVERIQSGDFHMMAGDEVIDMIPAETGVVNNTDFSLFTSSSLDPMLETEQTTSKPLSTLATAAANDNSKEYDTIDNVEVDTLKVGNNITTIMPTTIMATTIMPTTIIPTTIMPTTNMPTTVMPTT